MKSWPASLALSLSFLSGSLTAWRGGSPCGDEAAHVSQNEAGGSQLVTPGLGPEEYKDDWVCGSLLAVCWGAGAPWGEASCGCMRWG